MKLTKRQVELGAMYLAASNTGLIGISCPQPTSERDIMCTYDRISSDYEHELGEGLDSEKAMFAKDIRKGEFIETLQKAVPFIFS